jgi:uncharacterized protein YceK
MGRFAQKIVLVFVALLFLGGCGSLKSTELTFAGKGVMLRGIEPITTSVEYYDKTAKSVKVKRARIDPPVWIVSEDLLDNSAAPLERK